MRYLFTFMCVLALVVMGCGDAAGTSGSGGDGGSGGVGGTNGEPVPLAVYMTSFEPPTVAEVVEGMRICELDTANCAVTDEGGLATLEVSAGQEIALTMEKEGFGSYIYTYVVPADGGMMILGNATDARFEEMFGLVMSPYPMEGTGSVWVSGSPEGAVLSLLGATGKAFYADDDVKASWSLDLTAATANGGGGFVEVPAGEYQVEVTGTSENCFPVRGWPGDSENTVRMPVREGYLSSARMLCDQLCDVGAFEVQPQPRTRCAPTPHIESLRELRLLDLDSTDVTVRSLKAVEPRIAVLPGDTADSALDYRHVPREIDDGGAELTFAYIRSNTNMSETGASTTVHGIDDFKVVIVGE